MCAHVLILLHLWQISQIVFKPLSGQICNLGHRMCFGPLNGFAEAYPDYLNLGVNLNQEMTMTDG